MSEDLVVTGNSHVQAIEVGLNITVAGDTTLGRVAINDTLLQRGACTVEGTLLVQSPLTVQARSLSLSLSRSVCPQTNPLDGTVQAQCNIHSMHVSDQVRGRSTLELNPSEIVVEGKTTLKSELEALKGVTNLRCVMLFALNYCLPSTDCKCTAASTSGTCG